MTNTPGFFIFTISFVFCLGTLITGLIKPKLVLRYFPEQTRLRAVIFSVLLFFFLSSIAYQFDNGLDLVVIAIFNFPLPILVYFWSKKKDAQATNIRSELSNSPLTKKKRRYTVPSFTGSDIYTIIPAETRCSCPDWQESRSHFAEDDPRRACKHLTSWFAIHQSDIPDALRPYAPMLVAKGYDQRGMPSSGTYIYGDLNGCPYVFCISKENWPWVDVAVSGLRYGVNMDRLIWAKGEEPLYSKEFERLIAQECGLEYPPQSATSHTGDSQYTYEQPHEATVEGDVVPMLLNALGTLPDGLECVQRKTYFVVYGTKPRNWFCRVKYNAYGLTEVELFDGHIMGVTSGRIYKNSQSRFARMANAFDWKKEA